MTEGRCPCFFGAERDRMGRVCSCRQTPSRVRSPWSAAAVMRASMSCFIVKYAITCFFNFVPWRKRSLHGPLHVIWKCDVEPSPLWTQLDFQTVLYHFRLVKTFPASVEECENTVDRYRSVESRSDSLGGVAQEGAMFELEDVFNSFSHWLLYRFRSRDLPLPPQTTVGVHWPNDEICQKYVGRPPSPAGLCSDSVFSISLNTSALWEWSCSLVPLDLMNLTWNSSSFVPEKWPFRYNDFNKNVCSISSFSVITSSWIFISSENSRWMRPRCFCFPFSH